MHQCSRENLIEILSEDSFVRAQVCTTVWKDAHHHTTLMAVGALHLENRPIRCRNLSLVETFREGKEAKRCQRILRVDAARI